MSRTMRHMRIHRIHAAYYAAYAHTTAYIPGKRARKKVHANEDRTQYLRPHGLTAGGITHWSSETNDVHYGKQVQLISLAGIAV